MPQQHPPCWWLLLTHPQSLPLHAQSHPCSAVVPDCVSNTTELTCVTSTGGHCPSWHQSLSWKRSHPRALQWGKLDLKWASVFSSPPPNLVPFSCCCLAESRNTLFPGLFLALFQGWVMAHQCIGSCCRDSAQLVPTFSRPSLLSHP